MTTKRKQSALDRLATHDGRSSVGLVYTPDKITPWRITTYQKFAMILADGRTPEEAARNALRQIEGKG